MQHRTPAPAPAAVRRGSVVAVLLTIALVLGAAACGRKPVFHGQPQPVVVGSSPSAEPSSGESPGPGTAAASSSARPSPSRSATKAPPAPAPPSGGKPGPGNTGVPTGTALRVVAGDQVFSTAGQVISGLDIHGYVRIRAKNVTLKNSVVRGGAAKCNAAVIFVESTGSARIEDTDIIPTNPNACLDGVWAANSTLLRLDVRNVVDGVKAFDNMLVQDSYIHDLSYFASDPNQGGGSTHNDAVQTYGGNHNIRLRHNTMLAGSRGNAGYQVTQDGHKVSTDLHIEDNWIDGGGCMLNFSHKGGPTPMTGIYVVGNRFGRGSRFQCPILISTQTVLSQNTGNVWDDTGAPIPKPQQHD